MNLLASYSNKVAMVPQKGVGLIEVVVSLLIISIGVLGMAGLQINAKRAAHEAVQRTTAAYLASDMLERMRSNPSVLASYVTAGLGGGSITSEPSPNCLSAACTAAELAAHDLWAWEQSIDGATETRTVSGTLVSTGGMLDPTGCISHSSGTITIAVAWKGYQALSNPTSTTCGSGLGKYGTNDANRQVLVMSTYIYDD